jgi:hypothetical protein
MARQQKRFFFYLFTCFPRVVKPIDYAAIWLSLEGVAVLAGHKVLMDVDDNGVLIIRKHGQVLVIRTKPWPSFQL